MTRWEYKIIEQTKMVEGGMLSKKEVLWEPRIDFDQLGNKGWELVAVVPIGETNGYSTPTKYIRYHFKRSI